MTGSRVSRRLTDSNNGQDRSLEGSTQGWLGLLNTGLSVKGTVAIAEELDSGANGMWDTPGILDASGWGCRKRKNQATDADHGAD